MNKIELNKKYRTRDGREVRIYATDAGGVFPVHGAYKKSEGTWSQRDWTKEGRFVEAREHLIDLIEVKPMRKVWIEVYSKANMFGSTVCEQMPSRKIGDEHNDGWKTIDIIEAETDGETFNVINVEK